MQKNCKIEWRIWCPNRTPEECLRHAKHIFILVLDEKKIFRREIRSQGVGIYFSFWVTGCHHEGFISAGLLNGVMRADFVGTVPQIGMYFSHNIGKLVMERGKQSPACVNAEAPSILRLQAIPA